MIAGCIIWVEDSKTKTFQVSTGRLSLEEAEELIKGYCDKESRASKVKQPSEEAGGTIFEHIPEWAFRKASLAGHQV